MDIVVTVPKSLWKEWIEEGDAAGEPPSGEEWGFRTAGGVPRAHPNDRCYVVSHGRLRGYAPISRIVLRGNGVVICRKGGAVAVTLREPIRGFQGWRYRWWDRAWETSFPEWKTEGVAP